MIKDLSMPRARERRSTRSIDGLDNTKQTLHFSFSSDINTVIDKSFFKRLRYKSNYLPTLSGIKTILDLSRQGPPIWAPFSLAYNRDFANRVIGKAMESQAIPEESQTVITRKQKETLVQKLTYRQLSEALRMSPKTIHQNFAKKGQVRGAGGINQIFDEKS